LNTFNLGLDVASSELVERLLNDLLKTTEGYQTLKNQIEMMKHDEQLNQQALVPLQKENERITKENNRLHLDIIKVKEERDSCDVKWRSALRLLQEEC
jgi:centrosomal protein CEP135